MNIIRITDINDPALSIFKDYSENQLAHIYEPNCGIFIGESPNVIARALKAGYIPISVLVEDKHICDQAEKVFNFDIDDFEDYETRNYYLENKSLFEQIPVFTASFDILTGITGFKLTRGMLCAFRRKPLPSIAEVCKETSRIAILENVVNPTNVGAIIRSAAALNVDAILLTPGCCDPLYRRAIRVSMGTVFQIPWTYICNKTTQWPIPYMNTLKSLGFKTAAMALTDNSVSINNPDVQSEKKLAIILGTEGEGLLPETIASCDYTIKIPMSHNVDSLNVAAASAVAFWSLCN